MTENNIAGTLTGTCFIIVTPPPTKIIDAPINALTEDNTPIEE